MSQEVVVRTPTGDGSVTNTVTTASPRPTARPRRPSFEAVAVALITAFALFARATVALTVPLWQGPDEPKHFEYVRLLVDKRAQLWAERRILNLKDASPPLQREIIASLVAHRYWSVVGRPTPDPLPDRFDRVWGNGTHTQLHRPSLYYFVAAAGLLPFEGASLDQQARVVRLVSAILSALCVPVAFLAGRSLFPRDRFLPIVAAAFVAGLPMHVFIGGVVNNDNLTTLLGSLLALALARALRGRGGLGSLALALALLLLGLATKRTFVGLIPALLLAGLFVLASLRGRRLLLAAAAVAVPAALVVAIGAGALQPPLPLEQLRAFVIAYALNHPGQLSSLLAVPLDSPEVQALVLHQLDRLFRSFWGIFGWFSLYLSEGLYQALAAVSLVCALGALGWLIASLGRQIRRSDPTRATQLRALLVFAVAVAGMVVLAVGERLAYLKVSEVPQGRYLFDAIVPIALIYALGARAVLPERFVGSRLPALLCVLALVALDAAVFARYFVPFYGIAAIPFVPVGVGTCRAVRVDTEPTRRRIAMPPPQRGMRGFGVGSGRGGGAYRRDDGENGPV